MQLIALGAGGVVGGFLGGILAFVVGMASLSQLNNVRVGWGPRDTDVFRYLLRGFFGLLYGGVTLFILAAPIVFAIWSPYNIAIYARCVYIVAFYLSASIGLRQLWAGFLDFIAAKNNERLDLYE